MREPRVFYGLTNEQATFFMNELASILGVDTDVVDSELPDKLLEAARFWMATIDKMKADRNAP